MSGQMMISLTLHITFVTYLTPFLLESVNSKLYFYHILVQPSELDSALKLVRSMEKEYGLRLDLIMYTDLVRWACVLSNWDERFYWVFVDWYSKEGRCEEGDEFVEQLIKEGVFANVVTYTSLSNGFCQRGLMKRAREILLRMEADGIVPNVVHGNETTGHGSQRGDLQHSHPKVL